jgi:hypothetical protein
MSTWVIISCVLVSFVAGFVAGQMWEMSWWRRLREKDFESIPRNEQ